MESKEKNTTFQLFTNNNKYLLYYSNAYLKIQDYKNPKTFSTDEYLICFDLSGSTAKSLPNSPFGGFIGPLSSQDAANEFVKQTCLHLSGMGIKKMIITQPPDYYPFATVYAALQSQGFRIDVKEVNQYIDLHSNIHLHEMERRQLKKEIGLSIRVMDGKNLEEIYDFIAFCRNANSLTINISFDRLQELVSALPDRYELFAGYIDGKLVTALICCRTTENIAYYYLPATHPDFKSLSPMVHLLAFVYNYYRQQDFDFIDLGISSINGDLQKSLFQFKARMGAKSTERLTFIKEL